MDLKNVNLLSLQTAHMQQDPTTRAMCAALEPQFRQLADEVKACLIYSRVNELEAPVLDELAWQMSIDWYDANASLEQKRELVKSAIRIHRLRGTPAAVEEVVKSYFGNGIVKEWFEYGGDPYTFKVIVQNQSVSGELAARFTMAVNAVKNLRSHMDELIVGHVCSTNLHCSEALIII